MTSTPSLVTIVNEIAHSLGHAGALSDEQLANVPTHAATVTPLAAWRDAFDQNVAAATEAAVAAGHGWSAPQAVWLPFERLGEAPRGVVHTTQTGRLTILADDEPVEADWALVFTFEAGPLPGDREGRVVLSVAWTCVDGRISFSVDELDAVLLAEKPSRVALLMQLAGAAGLPVDPGLSYAIAIADAHDIARASLLERSVARLESVLPRRMSSVLSFGPEDVAPVQAQEA